MPARLKLALLASALVLLRPGQVLAQPVNAEALRPNSLEAGWGAGIDTNLTLSRGNVELLDVGGAARLSYQTLHAVTQTSLDGSVPVPFIAQRVFLTGNGQFAERAETPFINQGFAHLRWTGMWLRRLGSEVFAQHSFNEFFRLRARTLLGTGARVAIVQRAELMLWGGSGAMLEYERIDVAAGASDDSETLGLRATTYLTARIALWDAKFLLQNTSYYQPKFDRFVDYRFLNELEAIANVTDVFGFGATLSIQHDNRPPTGVKKTDLRLGNTVRVSF